MSPPHHIGPYQVVRPLGEGGMGRVYEVRAPGDPRRLALKLLIRAGASQRARFRREGELLARLSHPAIIPVHAVGATPEGLPYLVTDLVGGRPLEEVLREGPRTPDWARRFGAALARALEHAHAAGIVHRDVKPGNVLVDAAGEVRLIDFGVAYAADQERLTATGQVVGTMHYMAPEQLDGREVGPAADVYALGAVLYECLTGRRPIEGESGVELAMRIAGQTPPPLRELCPEADLALGEALSACLVKEARYRPSAGALAAVLEDPTLRLRQARSRWPVALAGALALLALGLGLALGHTLSGPEPRPVEAPAVPSSAAAGEQPAEPAAPRRWALARGDALEARVTWTRSDPVDLVCSWTYSLQAEEVDPRQVRLAAQVLRSSVRAGLIPATGGGVEPAGRISFWLDPRTGQSLRVRGITRKGRGEGGEGRRGGRRGEEALPGFDLAAGFMDQFNSDEFVQMTLSRLLHLFPADAREDQTSWSVRFPLMPDGPQATRACTAEPRPGGGQLIRSQVIELPADLIGKYALSGTAEWVDGRVIKARVEEEDSALSFGNTTYEWELRSP